MPEASTPAGPTNTCAINTPYVGTYIITVPSTLLLPSGTITISKTWILPNASKVIGQGTGESGYSVTTLQTGSTFPGSNWMIQMGPNSSSTNLTPCVSAPLATCTEISVEDLALQGPSTTNSVNGIINGQSQDMSYVRRVSIYRVGGIGLKLWKGESTNSAQNSGPYSDISFDAGTIASTKATVCAQILNIGTRGIHGLTCKTESSTPSFAVQIGSSNNSVRDAHISGAFTDGIQVTSGASNTLLFNITGGSSNTYLIHLLSGNSSPNVSIMGASKGGTSGSTNTLFDEMTGTTLQDSYLAMYALGTSGVGSNGYSRYTTSTSSNAITWGSGSSTPTHSVHQRIPILEHLQHRQSLRLHRLRYLDSTLLTTSNVRIVSL